MSSSHLLRFHVRYMGCLLRRNCVANTIPIWRLNTECWFSIHSFTRRASKDNLLSIRENYTLLRTRVLSNEAVPEAKSKRGRRPLVPNEDTKQYLTSLGLDCERIQANQPMVLTQELSQVKSHVALLQRLNFSEREIVEILTKTPVLMKVDTSSVHEHIKFLQDLGLENVLILNIFRRVPRFFASPLSTIKPNVEYIQSFNLTSRNLRSLLKYAPSLVYRKKDGVRQAGEALRGILLKHDPTCNPQNSLKYMIRTDPLLFGRSANEIEHRVEHLNSLGFTGLPLANIVRFCPSAVRIGTKFITERLKLVQSRLSLSDEEARDIVMRLPKILHASNKTINTKVDFLFQKGFKAADIYQAPRVLNSSIQRMESRLEKMSALDYRPNTLSIMQRSEEWFSDFLEDLKQRKEAKEEGKDSSDNRPQE